MAIIIENNYGRFKGDFKTDTRLDADENLALYIAYYNARINDQNIQATTALLRAILEKTK